MANIQKVPRNPALPTPPPSRVQRWNGIMPDVPYQDRDDHRNLYEYIGHFMNNHAANNDITTAELCFLMAKICENTALSEELQVLIIQAKLTHGDETAFLRDQYYKRKERDHEEAQTKANRMAQRYEENKHKTMVSAIRDIIAWCKRPRFYKE